jgi:hypothetical protein
MANFSENLVAIALIFPLSMPYCAKVLEATNRYGVKAVLKLLKVGGHCEAMLDFTKNKFD